MRYLLLFFVSFSVFANYADISEVESGNISKVFRLKKYCGDSCIKLPINFNKNYFSVVDEMVNDMERPIYEAKSNVVSCVDEADCIEKESVHICDQDNGYFSVRLLDNSEVYCTKLLGYEQKLTGNKFLKEDPVKKAAYEAAELARKNAKAAKKTSFESLVQKLQDGATLTPVELSEYLLYLVKRGE